MKKQILSTSFLLIALITNAQTISLTTATPTSSSIGGGSSVLIGTNSGTNLSTGSSNVFVGTNSGLSNTTGADNTFLGWGSGPSNINGHYNVFVGRSSGNNNVSGIYNTFLGSQSGFSNVNGVNNTSLGFGAGYTNVGGGNNVLVGSGAGYSINSWGNTILGWNSGFNAYGDGNVFIGQSAGKAAGSGNIMIGSGAGETANVNNKLYIHNSNSPTPTIYGDLSSQKIGIGGFSSFPLSAGSVDVSNYKLFVKGGILTEEVRVSLNSAWADYVFDEKYKLPSLEEVEKHIQTKGHLINVPNAKEVSENGIEVGEMLKIQQEKIEELTLYIIKLNKEVEKLKNKKE